MNISKAWEFQKFLCLIATEENVKEACRNFKIYLELMRNFGGEEIIEY